MPDQIVKPIDLGQYSAAYKGRVMWLWVNPPSWLDSEGMDAARACQRDPRDKFNIAKLCAWLAVMWSMHEDPETHWTADEIETFVDQCYYQDKGLFDFIMQASFELVFQEYKDKLTKNDEVTH